MNCLEFHRLKLADPRRVSAEAREHARACAACRDFAQRVDETEAELAHRLSVPVPDGLAERVLLARRRPVRPAWRVWAIAATVVLAVAVAAGVRQWKAPVPAEDYARLAIEHVMMEPESLTMVRNADPALLAAAIDELGGKLKGPIGKVRYIRICPVDDGGSGWHIVFETPHGLATLLLVPDKRIGSSTALSVGSWNAIVQPMPRGYYAVVTASPDTASGVDRMIREQLDTRA